MSIYLDNAATSFPKPESVYQAVDDFQRAIGGNPGRGNHKRSRKAFETVAHTRNLIAKLFNINTTANIVFTFNGTEALNLALKGTLRPGDHAITSVLEHNSVNRPLYKLSTQGVEITRLNCDPNGGLDLNELSKNIQKNTRLIALTHGSNVLGTILPIAEAGSIARDRGILFLVDAAQTAGKIPIDIEAMKIDLLACPGHKGLLGPQGTGFLYIREGIELETMLEGGTGSKSESASQPDLLPDRFESGTLNGPGIAGLGAGIEFILKEGLDKIYQKKQLLLDRLWTGLAENKKVKLYGPEPSSPCTSVVSFNIEGLHCEDAGSILDTAFNIEVRSGLHCAPGVHKLLNTFPEGAVRVSPGYFNTPEDIDAVIKALADLTRRK